MSIQEETILGLENGSLDPAWHLLVDYALEVGASLHIRTGKAEEEPKPPHIHPNKRPLVRGNDPAVIHVQRNWYLLKCASSCSATPRGSYPTTGYEIRVRVETHTVVSYRSSGNAR